MSRTNVRGLSSKRLDEERLEATCKAYPVVRLLIRAKAAQHPQEMQRTPRAPSQFNLAAHFMLIRNMRYITHFTRLIIIINLGGTVLPYYFRQTSLDSLAAQNRRAPRSRGPVGRAINMIWQNQLVRDEKRSENKKMDTTGDGRRTEIKQKGLSMNFPELSKISRICGFFIYTLP